MEWVKKLKHTVWEGMEYGNTDKEKKERRRKNRKEGKKVGRVMDKEIKLMKERNKDQYLSFTAAAFLSETRKS